MHQSLLKLPPGVTLNQCSGNVFRLHYDARTVLQLQLALNQCAASLLDNAIKAVEAQRDAELSRHQLPVTRLQTIDQELETLHRQRSELLVAMGPAAPGAMPQIAPSEETAEAVPTSYVVPEPDPLAHPGLRQVPPPVAGPPPMSPTAPGSTPVKPVPAALLGL